MDRNPFQQVFNSSKAATLSETAVEVSGTPLFIKSKGYHDAFSRDTPYSFDDG
ncbi:MAG: hypothetical protein NVS4B7_07260 [Ktedonobacteraceae bacterium]